MSLCGQADPSYATDFNKLKKHAYILAMHNQCYQSARVRRGSIFLRGTEEVRTYCNGALDEIEKAIN